MGSTKRIKSPPDQFSTIFRAAQLRYRATECRAIAQDLIQPHMQADMLKVADEYEQLANQVEGYLSDAVH